ncbi:alanine dehydrogenase [Pseudonocardia endophytica]|uniref:Alanine dehydrogenase n=1 Tax=Pseudonocardia endophytica TaxID=401976 RepID=A0A4R1HXW7_PSEEN|nr:alanine dehydrogenase [Pseudonocardia endophytica]TCK26373.1 alanine dehydrogenase [Pseudonocardia endophytica]
MRIGVPREVKDNEFRVALTPAGVDELVRRGHDVVVENGAGDGSSCPDDEYSAAGARLLPDADQVWDSAELLLKVKEPVESEYHRLRSDLTLFTYLHLAASKACTDALIDAGTTAIAYETVRTADGRLPLLAPMSEAAGRIAPQAGAYHLMRSAGGRGVLMGGVPGAPGAHVVVIGAGVSGSHAVQIAAGMGARVTVLDVNLDKLRALDDLYRGRVQTQHSTSYAVEHAVLDADLVIGAVLVPGAKAPVVVSNDLVARAKPGAVFVDIAVDQGGCFADTHPTTHAEPTFPVHSAVFYCVANMPGAVPNTSTRALTAVTLPYVIELAEHGWKQALRDDPALAGGLSTHAGRLTNGEVAQAHGLSAVALDDVLG